MSQSAKRKRTEEVLMKDIEAYRRTGEKLLHEVTKILIAAGVRPEQILSRVKSAEDIRKKISLVSREEKYKSKSKYEVLGNMQDIAALTILSEPIDKSETYTNAFSQYLRYWHLMGASA